MAQADDNAARLKTIYELFFAGEIASMGDYFTEDAVIVEVASLPYPGEFIGPAGLAEIAGRLMATWDDLRFDIVDILASDSRAAGIGTFSAVGKATGQRVSFPMAEIWTFESGKVTRCEPVYGDTAQVRKAAGLPPL